MPHVSVPSPGLQAIILCGPGVSLNTFTSSPRDFPKALVPIANRPMVWYALDWSYRMGVNDITLITPPESADALRAALDQNPYLTSLPTPKPDILAPSGLTQTTGTGEIFRLPEVQKLITRDFIVVPCDLICELEGHFLTETWMTHESGFGGATGGIDANGRPIPLSINGEKSGRRGGLAVWYDTQGEELKKLETDFCITTPLPQPKVRPYHSSLRPNVEQLCVTMSTDSLGDIYEEHGTYPIRHSLIRKYPRTKFHYTYRDSHIYILPYWVKEWMALKEFDTISEDVLGWWAKAGWQKGLVDKLRLREVLQPTQTPTEEEETNGITAEDVDLRDYITTSSYPVHQQHETHEQSFASRVRDPENPFESIKLPQKASLPVPPVLAYFQPPAAPETQQSQPLIRRVDTAPLLLNISLRLAKLPSITELQKADPQSKPSVFAHPLKISSPESVPRISRVEADSCLLDANVTVGEKASIKDSVIGAGCEIGIGARVQRCILMEGVVIGDGVVLNGCILGRRCKIEGRAKYEKGTDKGVKWEDEETATSLVNCEVAPGFLVPWGTEAKEEKFMSFEGLSDEEDGEEQGQVDDIAEGMEGVDLGFSA